MIPLAEITGEKNSDAQTKYNRRIPLSQIVGDTAPQAEPEKTGDGFWDTAGNAFDWWKNNSLAGAGFLGGLLAETTGNVAESLGKEFPENSWRRNLLESAGNLAQDAADTMLDYGTKKVYTANGDNFGGAFANQLMSGLTGSYSGLASMIHADKSADALMKARQATENKTPVSTDDLGEYFTNPHGFASDVGQLGGSMAAIAPFMGLAPIGAVTRGVATFGGDAITQALINRGLYNAAKIFAGGAPRAVQYGVTSAPIEGAMEGGETRRELLNRGASEEEATRESLITMGKNVPLLLATNTLEGLAFFSPLKVSNKALQIAGRGAVNSAQEQYEEFAQEGIQNAARGEPYSWLPWNGAPNQYEAAERVRYPAALLGGIGGATQAISGTDENQENWKRGDQTSNLTAKQAEVWDAARYASTRAKEKFGYDISPELIYKQWAHESGGTNFDSENARYNNNFGGLTQVEPNGEENKQLDGNNYYRHFSNVWEYADAYVDDFIKYYPEISGTNNEREFAGVLKKYDYFGDDLENYVAGMEGIQAPANRTSGNQPKIDFAAGLQSAREALDGKQMENGTVGCVEAVTKILSHVHPEFKKMVDDGVVNTVEGENSLHSRLEQMGVEIIPFDESKVAQGDIIFYDGKQTYQHVLVADHKDADGNWRVFGNSSSANKVMEQPLYQGQTPAWIAKVSNLQGANVQTQQTRQKETQEAEPTKPLFDLNSEDSTTQKLLEQFANERFESAIKNEDGETADFFNAMFDDDSKFQDTPENRQAITTRYGDELDAFVQKNSQTPPQQKPPETKGKAKQENPYDRNTALIQTGRKYLDELLKKGDEPSRKTAWTLNSAIQNNDLAKVENILKQNNVAI
ncbi:MAG: glucosaminidase domain-containing protein, partial [Selenomonadaceae bacterium]|nr:glucosaminidase domain-containing protein [Selenomonadaceae bacterium]